MEENAKLKAELKTKGGFIRVTIDILMIIVVIVNLAFVLFDWGFDFVIFQDFVQGISNDLFIYYRDNIHPNFFYYDSYFITLFVGELFLQWFISIIVKTYAKWWLYPFINWYDVLGCIPLAGFIWLRLFRIIALSIRLHKMGVINLRKTFVYKQFYSNYQIFILDAADRALIKLIEALQRGVKNDDEAGNSDEKSNVIVDAIKPDQHQLAKVLSTKIHQVVDSNYRLHRDDMKKQIEAVIKKGFDNSEELQKLEHIPFVGSRISDRLEALLNDLSFQLADSLSSKLASDEVAQIIEQVVNTTIESMMKETTTKTSDKELNGLVKDIVDRALQQLIEDIDEKRKMRTNILEPEADE
jgi:hypothetical protein